ncbi:hypothetical protein OXX59_003219 [Metschnikowia pulcherrima]
MDLQEMRKQLKERIQTEDFAIYARSFLSMKDTIQFRGLPISSEEVIETFLKNMRNEKLQMMLALSIQDLDHLFEQGVKWIRSGIVIDYEEGRRRRARKKIEKVQKPYLKSKDSRAKSPQTQPMIFSDRPTHVYDKSGKMFSHEQLRKMLADYESSSETVEKAPKPIKIVSFSCIPTEVYDVLGNMFSYQQLRDSLVEYEVSADAIAPRAKREFCTRRTQMYDKSGNMYSHRQLCEILAKCGPSREAAAEAPQANKDNTSSKRAHILGLD